MRCQQGGAENLESALKTLAHTYALRIRHLGRDHASTLHTAGHLADTQRKMGMLAESVALQRRVVAGERRVLGVTHMMTLENEAILAETLAEHNELDEAREIRDRLLPIATRILGPDHRITDILHELDGI